MRRQVEISKKDKLAIITLTLFWIIALTALSASAHGLQLSGDTTTQKTTVSDVQMAPEKPEASVQPTEQSAETETETASPETEAVNIDRFILISIPDRQLAFIDNGRIVKVYPIAVGADGTPSPTGDYTIITHVVDPVYHHEGKTIPPGKNNPVGSRWMGLSLKGYGIHGTNVQSSIGKAVSHGCFRLKKADIEELFTMVKVGDVVSIRGERDELVAKVFGGETQTMVARNGF